MLRQQISTSNLYHSRSKPKLTYLLPIISIASLVIISIIATNPNVANPAHAEEGDISSLADGISLSIDGNSSGDSYNKSINAVTNQTNYISYNVVATASNIESYSLSIKYATGSTSLKNSTSGATTISNVASAGVLGKNMTSNTWGWGWSDSTTTANGDITYRPMSTSDSVIKSATTSSANVNGKVVFAANFGEGATAGHYTTNALISFAIQPKAVIEITDFAGYTTMQEMTTAKCSAISNGTEGRLKDIRDNKWYWVAKLPDGNCWMTQNLDYDIKSTGIAGTELAQTDLSAAWTTSSTHQPAATKTGATPSGFSDGYNDTAISWDPGDKYCGTTGCNLSTSANGGHDHQGNYYTYTAAVAGTNGGTVTTNASGSICPKGWQLPVNGDVNTDKSFVKLTNGLSDGTSLTASPYYFAYSGDAYGSALSGAGVDGTYRTSSSRGTVDAYYMFFNSATLDSSTRDLKRYVGMSVRCVAK